MQREMNCILDAHVPIVAGQPVSHFVLLLIVAGMDQCAFGSADDAPNATKLQPVKMAAITFPWRFHVGGDSFHIASLWVGGS